jgi:hypothetical protein
MRPRQTIQKPNIIHLEKVIRAPVRQCFSAFGSTRVLRHWYDSEARLSGFKVNGEVKGSYFPGYFLVAIVRNQLIAQSFTTVIDGFGLWNFVTEEESTRVLFDHVAAGNQGDEGLARTFHWKGLLENLAATCEGRPAPFVNGQYRARHLPQGIHQATCLEYVQAKGRRQSRGSAGR